MRCPAAFSISPDGAIRKSPRRVKAISPLSPGHPRLLRHLKQHPLLDQFDLYAGIKLLCL